MIADPVGSAFARGGPGASAIAAGREAIELLRRAGAADTEIFRVRINLLYDHLTVGDTPLPTLRDELVGIVAGLEAAPGSDRELLILRVWDGLSFAEAAQVLGCSPGAARVRWLRVRRRFAAELTREDPDPERAQPLRRPYPTTIPEGELS